MSQSIKDRLAEQLAGKHAFEELMQEYLNRYEHKSTKEKKNDLLLQALLMSAIDNMERDEEVTIDRLAELTFSRVEEVQEHLSLIVQVYPDIGTYSERDQRFVSKSPRKV